MSVLLRNFTVVSITLQDLPCLTILGQTEVSSSKAIARYLARKFNLCGQSDLEDLQIDAVVDTTTDLLELLITRIGQDKSIVIDAETKSHLDRLEKAIGLYGKNSYSVASETGLKWCDLAVYDATAYLVELIPNSLDSYENISRVRTSVEANERISGYLKYRPTTPFMIREAL